MILESGSIVECTVSGACNVRYEYTPLLFLSLLSTTYTNTNTKCSIVKSCFRM